MTKNNATATEVRKNTPLFTYLFPAVEATRFDRKGDSHMNDTASRDTNIVGETICTVDLQFL